MNQKKLRALRIRLNYHPAQERHYNKPENLKFLQPTSPIYNLEGTERHLYQKAKKYLKKRLGKPFKGIKIDKNNIPTLSMFDKVETID